MIILQEVLNAYEILRAEFPNAELHAGNLEDFFVAANVIKDKLPILTNEIGDTWIQGVASDPRKCAEYRAVSRVMKDCVASGYYNSTVTKCYFLKLFFILSNADSTWLFFCAHICYWSHCSPIDEHLIETKLV